MKTYGRFNMEHHSNVIMIDVFGSFNLEGAKELYEQLISTVTNLPSTKYYLFENLLGFEGATDEAFELADKYNRWINKYYPPQIRVVVVQSEAIKEIIFNEKSVLHAQHIRLFEDKAKALSYLHTH